MRSDYGWLSDSIVSILLQRDRITVLELSAMLGRPEWEIASAVDNSLTMVRKDKIVMFDEMIDDPDYGLVRRKEAEFLRKCGYPTIHEIRRACAELRAKREATSRNGGSVDDVDKRIRDLVRERPSLARESARFIAGLLGCSRSVVLATPWWRTHRKECKCKRMRGGTT